MSRRPASCTARTLIGAALTSTTSFDVPGVHVPPAASRGASRGGSFVNFLPAIGNDERKTRCGRVIRRWRLHRWSGSTLTDLAKAINAEVPGLDQLLRALLPLGVESGYSDGSTNTSFDGPAGSTSGCAATPPRHAGSWPLSSDASPACSRTGDSACAPTAGRWEPDELERFTSGCARDMTSSSGVRVPCGG